MTGREELLRLAEAAEQASGADRTLDADVLEATGGCAHRETRRYCIEDGNDYDSGFTCIRCRKDTYGERVPKFTASLDAAMTLVPEGWYWRVDQGRNAGGAMFEIDGHRQLFTLAETPALALCAAALRARAAMMEEGE